MIGHNLPGQGLGFTASKELVFGLGAPWRTIIIITIPGDGYSAGDIQKRIRGRIKKEDEEILLVITIAILEIL